MAITVTSIDRTKVASNGGYRLKVTGVFPIGVALRIHIGETGTTADPECWSGVPGQGHDVYAISTTQVRCYTPILPVRDALSVLVRAPSTGESDLLSSALGTLPKDFRSAVFEMRKMWPPKHMTGPRRLEDEPAVTVWE